MSTATSSARALSLLALAASLAGCVAGTAPEPDVGTAQEALCLAEPLKGIDVSSYQGKIDWQAVAGDQIRFAFARVSIGVGYSDPRFSANWKHMKSAGLVRGAYQFFRPDQDAIAQAKLMLDHLDAAGGLEAGDLPPAIDVEVTEGVGHAKIVAGVRAWLDHVEKATGRRPIVYTSPGFWGVLDDPTGFAKYPLWIAHWGTDCPTVPGPWKHFAFWQKGPFDVAGIEHPVDGDYFDGSLDELLAFAGAAPSAPPPPAASAFAAGPIAESALASGDPAPPEEPPPAQEDASTRAASCAAAGGAGEPAGGMAALAVLGVLVARRRRR
jgi:lysozyme